MARKTKEAAAITREQVLDAAEHVFRERGVTQTSLAEVAAAAGVSRGAVYWHFADKADLYAAMCERAILPLDTVLATVASGSHEDPLATLRDLAVGALRHLATDARAQAVFEVMFHKTELCGELGAIAGRRERERCDFASTIEQLLRNAVVAGQLAPGTDPALATYLFHAFMSGLMREWVRDRGAYDLAALAPNAVEMIIAGFIARPPRLAERIRPRVRPRTPAS
jgi:TetR/AcrR family transcriptional regulator, acrAB operon repressor